MGVDGNDPPAVPLHVCRNVVSRFGRSFARSDHRDRVVRAQNAFHHVVGPVHGLSLISAVQCRPPRRPMKESADDVAVPAVAVPASTPSQASEGR